MTDEADEKLLASVEKKGQQFARGLLTPVEMITCLIDILADESRIPVYLAPKVVSLIPVAAQTSFREFVETVLRPDYRKGAWQGFKRTEEEIVRESSLLTARIRVWAEHFKIITFLHANPDYLTTTVLALVTGIYEEKAFDRMPILADALQDTGCNNEEILSLLMSGGPHVKGF
jgi:hypothetical protein